MLTPAEKQLARSFEGRRLIKAMRQQVLEAGRSVLEGIVEEPHSGREGRLGTLGYLRKSGEWVDVFVLDQTLEEG